VIWKGDKLIDGVPETLDLLRSKVRPEPQCSRQSIRSSGVPRDDSLKLFGPCGVAGQEAGVRDQQLHQVEEAVRQEV
jgi:hypothetical protein